MPRRPRHLRAALCGLAAVLLAAAVVTGCGGSDEPAPGDAGTAPATAAPDTTETSQPPPPTSTGTATPQGARQVTVYFASADADRLIEETRTVSGDGSDLRLALVELAKGPSNPDAVSALPPGTTIVGTDIRGGEAFVNLSAEFISGYPPGGAAAEFAVLAPLVYTSTAIERVERVRVTVDGRIPAPTGSQYDWSGGFTRADLPDVGGSAP